jgi:hypothetical protein
MKKTLLCACALLALVACKNGDNEPKNTLLVGSERQNFSPVGKIYTHYETIDADPYYYNVRYFINQDSIKLYHTERADGQVGKYNNIEYLTYYFKYPYVFKVSNRDTLFTYIQDSTIMVSKSGRQYRLVQ